MPGRVYEITLTAAGVVTMDFRSFTDLVLDLSNHGVDVKLLNDEPVNGKIQFVIINKPKL